MRLNEIKKKAVSADGVSYNGNMGVITYHSCLGPLLPTVPDRIYDGIVVSDCNGIKTLHSLPDISEFTISDLTVINCDSLAGLRMNKPIRLANKLMVVACPNLKTLDGIQRAETVEIKSLQSFERIGTPLVVNKLVIHACNRFVSFKSLIEDEVTVDSLLYRSIEDAPKDILNLLLVDKLKHAILMGSKTEDFRRAFELITERLPNTRGMKTVRECQSLMADEGLEEYAQL